MFSDLARVGKLPPPAARLMVGMPGDAYVQLRLNHGQRKSMSYEAFFRERQEGRYGGADGQPGRVAAKLLNALASSIGRAMRPFAGSFPFEGRTLSTRNRRMPKPPHRRQTQLAKATLEPALPGCA